MNKLGWQVLKERPQSNGGKRGRSGNRLEHAEAVVENASRILASEIYKALNENNS